MCDFQHTQTGFLDRDWNAMYSSSGISLSMLSASVGGRSAIILYYSS